MSDDTRLDWPAELPKRDSSERERCQKYDVTREQAFKRLETTLDRMGVEEYTHHFDARQKNNGRPYANANADDPSYALTWVDRGQRYAVGCDRWADLRSNVRTVGHYVEEKRKMEGRAVSTVADEYENLALPGDDERDEEWHIPPHELLDIPPDSPKEVVQGAFRAKVKDAHPDRGGSRARFEAIKDARDEMLPEGESA